MRHYCTYFDSAYLTRGLALYRSLARVEREFVLWVLCMDEDTFTILSRMNDEGIRPVKLSQLESFDPELVAVKTNRNRVEYYFTCSPCWPRYILAQTDAPALVTYLDADLYFYANPQPIFDELGDNSVLIVEHRFPRNLKHLECYGVYNVGLLSFRNDETGRNCLDRWRNQCIDWCYDRCENGRFADQKYLDDWPVKFAKVSVLTHIGCGVAPWNLETHNVHVKDKTFIVNKVTPLIFYHFHGLRQASRHLYDCGLSTYGESAIHRKALYLRYIEQLKQSERELAQLLGVQVNQIPHRLSSSYRSSELKKMFSSGRLLLSCGPDWATMTVDSFARTALHAAQRFGLRKVAGWAEQLLSPNS